MERITIEINTTNDAFADYPEQEVARILRELADKLEAGREPEKLMDINGNNIGFVRYE